MSLNAAGKIADDQWLGLPERFRDVDVDAHIVMPNHVHGIVVLGAKWSEQNPGEATTLWSVVKAFKAATSRLVREGGNQGFAWQRGFHDRIIRDNAELSNARQYVEGNPGEWHLDHENPDRNKGTTSRHR